MVANVSVCFTCDVVVSVDYELLTKFFLPNTIMVLRDNDNLRVYTFFLHKSQ